MDIKLEQRTESGWKDATTLVQNKYKRTFDADVMPKPDCFVACYVPSLEGTGSELVACTGVTFGSSKRFFSERYLDEPVEALLSRVDGVPVSRESIVEVGSLASIQRDVGSELVRITPLLMWCLGKQYIFCTASQPLRRLFTRVGITFQPLAESNISRLDEADRGRWGSYYELQPETGYIRLGGHADLISNSVKRYRFSVARETRSAQP